MFAMPTFELDRLISYDDEALLSELRRVAALVDSPYLAASAFDKHSKAHSSGIRRRFGGWQQALELAGLGDRYSGAPRAKRIVGRTFSDEQLLAELRAVSAKIGGNPVTVEVFNQHANMHAETVRRRFGSWWAALKQAGLEIASLGRRYSDEDYFENLLAVWTYYGRQPTYGEMDKPPSSIPPGAYEAKWSTWTKALLAFLERVNSDVGDTEPEPALLVEQPKPIPRRWSGRPRLKEEDQRQVKLSLRYKVLKRDRFRCVLCGASPAIHLGCILNVDHITPFSKDGKTVIENLRTLCEPCNLGKSDKDEVEANQVLTSDTQVTGERQQP
jgi:5-methylcytosine-specific restriction endonuclease McrA